MDNRSYFSGGSFKNYGTTSPWNINQSQLYNQNQNFSPIQNQSYNDPYVANFNPFENFSGQQVYGGDNYNNNQYMYAGCDYGYADEYVEYGLQPMNFQQSEQNENSGSDDLTGAQMDLIMSMIQEIREEMARTSKSLDSLEELNALGEEQVRYLREELVQIKEREELLSEENHEASMEYINKVSILSDDFGNKDELVESVIGMDVFKPKEASVGVDTTLRPLVIVKPVILRKMIYKGSLYVKLWEVGSKEKFDVPLLLAKKQIVMENSGSNVVLVKEIDKQPRNFMVHVKKKKERDKKKRGGAKKMKSVRKRNRGGGSTQIGVKSQIFDSKAKIVTRSSLLDKIVLEPPRVKLRGNDFGKDSPRMLKENIMVILCHVLWYCIILRLEVVRLALRSPTEGIT